MSDFEDDEISYPSGKFESWENPPTGYEGLRWDVEGIWNKVEVEGVMYVPTSVLKEWIDGMLGCDNECRPLPEEKAHGVPKLLDHANFTKYVFYALRGTSHG